MFKDRLCPLSFEFSVLYPIMVFFGVGKKNKQHRGWSEDGISNSKLKFHTDKLHTFNTNTNKYLGRKGVSQLGEKSKNIVTFIWNMHRLICLHFAS